MQEEVQNQDRELRIGTHSDLGDKTMIKWNKVQCSALPWKFSHISVDEFVDDHLTDSMDANVLQDLTQREMVIE